MTGERPPDILKVDLTIGVGEVVFAVGALAGMGVGLAIAENLRQWLLRGLAADGGLHGYALELTVTIGATVLGGLWAGITALSLTVVLAHLVAAYYRHGQRGPA